MAKATLHRLMRTFHPTSDPTATKLEKRLQRAAPMDVNILPCLNCGKANVRQSYGQIVRFCSKECKKKFKHGY